MKTTRIIIINLVLISSLMINACKKDDSSIMNPGSTSFSVRMTDAPTNVYTAVNVDIEGVQVMTNNGAAVNLNVNPGVYNLLNFADGKDTMIATATVPTGMVSQIRLILGSNNSVVMNGVTYPLKTPGAQESGLKLNVDAQLMAGVVYILKLDFDANRSIVQEGNGNFLLKPVIRIIDNAFTGSIHGEIMTTAGLPVSVFAVTGQDTLSTITAVNGEFIVNAATPGNYTVVMVPISPLLSVKVMNNVMVTTGHVTEVGEITF